MRALAVAVLLLSGCLAASPPPGPAPGGPALLEVAQAVGIDSGQPAREPAITVLHDGAIVVAAYWGPIRYGESPPTLPGNALQAPLLWKSADGGASWNRLDPGPAAAGARGNSDISLEADAAGTLYAASLTFQAGSLNTVSIGASWDGGVSWAWTVLQAAPLVDRPWVRAAPDGTVHVVWNDGRGILHAVSTDRGRTWSRAPGLPVEGGDGGFGIGPGGELAVRVVPLRGGGLAPLGTVDGVAVSVDAGRTWQVRDLPGERAWAALGAPPPDGTPRAWDPIAFDRSGALWAAWGEGEALRLARSEDLGETWSVVDLAYGEGGVVFFPFLRAGPRPGELAATWFVDPEGPAAARIAHRAPDGSVALATLEGDTGSADHGEYYEVAFRPDGSLGAAVPVFRDGLQLLEFRGAKSGR